jgi:hypothetical protein
MRTSGQGNEGVFILLVVVLIVVVTTILGGGPAAMLEVLNAIGRTVIDTISGWF